MTLYEQRLEGTGRLDGATGAMVGAAAMDAGAADPEMAERKVVTEGIVGCDDGEIFGDLKCGLRVNGASLKKTKVATEASGVSIQGHDQVGRVRCGPVTEINAIGAADHPPKEEMKSLAGAPVSGVREEVAKSPMKRGSVTPAPQFLDEGRGPEKMQLLSGSTGRKIAG